jgi:hypothetical protein
MFRPLQRRRLGRAAHHYADHRWPVLPGARLSGDRFTCDQIGCPTVTCHPALPDWEAETSLDPARIAGWWERSDYGVLLATGYAFDVLEVAGPIGRQLAREVRGPVAIAPPQRWMFFLAAGDSGAGTRLEPAGHPSMVLHRAGSWIPAPPTPLPSGAVRWLSRPADHGWEPADPDVMRRAVSQLLCRNRPARAWSRADDQSRRVWRLNSATSTAE